MLIAALAVGGHAFATSPASSAALQRAMLPPPRPAALPGAQPRSPPSPSQTQPPASRGPVKTPAIAEGPAAGSGCLAALRARFGDQVDAVALPGGEAACAVAEPVQVSALTISAASASERRTIALQPPVTLACSMATAVAGWLETSVQPLARGYYDKDVTALQVGGGHECRRRNRKADGPLSEHATGQALDIFAIGIGAASERMSIALVNPAGHGRFLGAIRDSACGAFRTAIGPGSDAAHADHLHIDIQPRRASSRFCQ